MQVAAQEVPSGTTWTASDRLYTPIREGMCVAMHRLNSVPMTPMISEQTNTINAYVLVLQLFGGDELAW